MLKIILSKNPALAIANETAKVINDKLSKKQKVLWLLAGGSAQDYYQLMSDILDLRLDFSGLTIVLGDERYDQNPNHQTATWPVFEKLELFVILQKKGAKFFDILSGASLEEETARFSSFLEKAVADENFLLVSLGIGADGHTAGIIPLDDPQLFKSVYLNKGLAVGHAHGGAHPNRVTISPELIMKAGRVLAYAVGKDKKPALETLKNLDQFFPETEWSSQLHNYPALYLTVKNAEIFTDQ